MPCRCVGIDPHNCPDLVGYQSVEEVTAILELATVAPPPEMSDVEMFALQRESLEAAA